MSRRLTARFVAAAAGSIALVPAGSGQATAAVTTTDVTVATTRSYELFDASGSDAASLRRIGGTSDGTTGDSVDLVALQPDGTRNYLARGLAVRQDGSWAWKGSLKPLVDNPSDRERPFTSRSFSALAAVPAGDSDALPGGPRWRGFSLTVAAWNEFRAEVGHPSNDFMFSQSGDSAWNDYNAFDSCGLCDGGLKLADGSAGPPLWFWNASVDGPFQMRTVSGTQRKVPSITVDGKAAYAGFFASRINPDAASLPRTAFNLSVDPASGKAFITETQPLVSCPSFPAETASDCPDFSSTGVTLTRAIEQSADGTTVSVVDMIRSTDSRPHTWEIHYINAVHAGPGSVGWRMPGAAQWSAATPTGPQSGSSDDWSIAPHRTDPVTSTIEVRSTLRSPASNQSPAGSFSISPRPLRLWFPNTGADRVSVDMGGTATPTTPSRVSFSYRLFTEPRLQMIASSLIGPNVIMSIRASRPGSASLRSTIPSGASGTVCGLQSVALVAGINRITCPLTYTGRQVARARMSLDVTGRFTADPWSAVSYSLRTKLK